MAGGSIQKIAAGRKDLFLLDPMIIMEDPGWNVRVESEGLKQHIRELADSIKEIGVQQPLTVFMVGGSPVVTDGHCRLLAVKLAISEGAEIKSIPVRNEERHSNEADRVLSMLTRNNGRPLSIPEQAEVVKRLLQFNWKEADISKKTGSSRQHVGNLIIYMSSSIEIQSMVNRGEVSATMAVEQIKQDGDGAEKTLKAAVKTANNQGRKKATKKHVDSKPKDIIRPIENYAGKLPEIYLDKSSEILTICKRLRELMEII